ncbi:MAG: hypothetical protein J5881_04130 [Clostridia bacterium]|nr:hypothetical protein [Clostridia bacterium]
MAIEITTTRQIDPEIIKRNVNVIDENGEYFPTDRYGVIDKNTRKVVIPVEYNYIQICDGYGFIARKDAYYYAFNSKGVMFVADVLGIESIGRHGVLVFEDAMRTKSVLVHWLIT